MPRILVINGSYRDDGITDQVTDIMIESLRKTGSEVEQILLRNHPIEFCLNCRMCTQHPGEQPGTCTLQDPMQDLVDLIEQSDAYILASPTNLGSVTALFKRFQERLTVYAYWPWEMKGPVYRKQHTQKKKAILVSSCAAPGFVGRWAYNTHKQLQTTAKIIGAKPVGTLFTGMMATQPDLSLENKVKMKARTLADKLR